MNTLYDLHSWSKHYREDALRETRKQPPVRVGREPRESGRLELSWSNPLALMRDLGSRNGSSLGSKDAT